MQFTTSNIYVSPEIIKEHLIPVMMSVVNPRSTYSALIVFRRFISDSYIDLIKLVLTTKKYSKRVTYCSDNRRIEISYFDGVREGPTVQYKGDTITSTSIWKKGILNGDSTDYYNNGRIMSRCTYINGKL